MYQPDGGLADTARLEDYVRAIRLRKWLVLGLTLAGVIVAIGFSRSQTTTYEATSQVALYPTPVGSVDGRLQVPNLEKEKAILASNDIASSVHQQIGSTGTPGQLLNDLSVQYVPDSDVLVASYTSADPTEAAAVVNAFVTIYRQRRLVEAQGVYDDLITATTEQLQVSKERETAVRQEINDENRALLQPELGAIQLQIRELGIARNQAESAKIGLERSPPAIVLATAEPPTSPLGIPASFILLAGLALGAVGGVIAAFVLERLDTTARDESDVANALGAAVMGSVPTLGWLNQRRSPLAMLTRGGPDRVAAAREAYRRIRSSLQFLHSSSGIQTVMVTSSSPGEGKSITSANLALALAQNGAKVVLISGDLRRPTLEKLFGLESTDTGLAEYLNGTAELSLQSVPQSENLWFVRAGYPPANPGELLGSSRFEQLMKELTTEYVDFVVVDTPPVLATADAVSAARYMDGVLVIVDTRTTETEDLFQVRADLERSGSRVLGAVMNRQKFKGSSLFGRKRNAYYAAESNQLSALQPTKSTA